MYVRADLASAYQMVWMSGNFRVSYPDSGWDLLYGDYSKLYEANHSSLRIRGFALSRSNALEEVMMDVIPLSQLEGADIADLQEVVSAPTAAPSFQMKKGNAGGGEIQMSIAEVAEGSAEEAAQVPMPALRENFAETAFFYPNLRTDSLGNVSISFTVPDALTQWRFLGPMAFLGLCSYARSGLCLVDRYSANLETLYGATQFASLHPEGRPCGYRFFFG